MKGEKGMGMTGGTGATGMKGMKGMSGAPGMDGSQGPQGEATNGTNMKQCFMEYPKTKVRDTDSDPASDKFKYHLNEAFYLSSNLFEAEARDQCKWVCKMNEFCKVSEFILVKGNDHNSYKCLIFGYPVAHYFLNTDYVIESALTIGETVTHPDMTVLNKSTTFVKSSCHDPCCVIANVGLQVQFDADNTTKLVTKFLNKLGKLQGPPNQLAAVIAPLAACCSLCRKYQNGDGDKTCKTVVYSNGDQASDGWWGWTQTLGTCSLYPANLPGTVNMESRPTDLDPNRFVNVTTLTDKFYCDAALTKDCIGDSLVTFPDYQTDGCFTCPKHPWIEVHEAELAQVVEGGW